MALVRNGCNFTGSANDLLCRSAARHINIAKNFTTHIDSASPGCGLSLEAHKMLGGRDRSFPRNAPEKAKKKNEKNTGKKY